MKKWKRVKKLYATKDSLGLEAEPIKLLSEYHRSFIRAGANLDELAKKRLTEINARSAGLLSKFGDKLRKENENYALLIEKEEDLSSYDCLILPGGFSYGDYLRTGAIARFSPVMKSLKAAANNGKLVFGICNGFQILCEAGLLPGALIRNRHLEFRCQLTNLRVENSSTVFSSECAPGQLLNVPISILMVSSS